MIVAFNALLVGIKINHKVLSISPTLLSVFQNKSFGRLNHKNSIGYSNERTTVIHVVRFLR